MIRIREILLTQYIGAITVALLLVDAIANAIQACMQVVAYGIMVHYRSGDSVFYSSSQRQFQWETLITTAIRATLYIVVSYVLVRWLYLQKATPEEEGQAAVDAEEEE